MTNYYCLVAGLPDLSLEDGKLNYTVANFKSEIYSELSEKDRKLIDLFYLKFDNANLLKLLKDKEAATDFEGNYSQNELLALISSVREGDAPDKDTHLIFMNLLLLIWLFPQRTLSCGRYVICLLLCVCHELR